MDNTVTLGGKSIHDAAINTDAWLSKAADPNERAQEAIDAFVERRARRREAAGHPVWYSGEDKQNTIGEYLVRLLDRFERIDAIRRGANPKKAKRWRHEQVACSVNCESDLSDNVLISIVAHADSADSIYCNEAIWLIAKCEYHYSDLPRAFDADVDRGIFDFVIGWAAEYLDGTPCERISDRTSVGYASNPTCELAGLIEERKRPTRIARDGSHILARDPESGRTVRLYPYANSW